jgi:hypothetical protein
MSIERRYALLKHRHDDLYYTETEVDALLADYYTSTEVDNIVDDYLPLAGGTLSGALTINADLTVDGNTQLGDASASSSVSGMTRYGTLSSDVNNATLGFELFAQDGTNNQRIWLFNDDSTNHVGIDFTYSTGLNAFQIRRVGTAIFEISATGASVDLKPSGTSKLAVNTTGLGFFATSPIAKPTVTGSRGGNAALASLLTALANYGLITNSTSA